LRQNRRPKIYYATQVAASPPTIVLFTNGPELFDNTYQRYLLKVFRDRLPFADVPIKMYLRNRNRGESPPPDDGPEDKKRNRRGRDQTPKSAPGKGGPKARRSSGLVDLSDLDFKSSVTDDDLAQEKGRYGPELWRDI
jgi:hypothetical protein